MVRTKTSNLTQGHAVWLELKDNCFIYIVAPQTHVITMAAFGVIGWGVFEMEGRQ